MGFHTSHTHTHLVPAGDAALVAEGAVALRADDRSLRVPRGRLHQQRRAVFVRAVDPLRRRDGALHFQPHVALQMSCFA